MTPAANASPAGALILVIEDEPRLASVVCDCLHAAGYRSEWVADGGKVIDAYHRLAPDLLLLDLMLPNRDGVDLCRALRAHSAVPLIMVTSRVEEADRLLRLEIGADDDICKPFSPREVIARIAAVLRRYQIGSDIVTLSKDLQIDESGSRASLHGSWLELTPVEFACCACWQVHRAGCGRAIN